MRPASCPPLRPFLDCIRATISTPGPASQLPLGLVRPARAARSLCWLCAFYGQQLGPLSRTFRQPAQLQRVPMAQPPVRGPAWWRSVKTA